MATPHSPSSSAISLDREGGARISSEMEIVFKHPGGPSPCHYIVGVRPAFDSADLSALGPRCQILGVVKGAQEPVLKRLARVG